MYRQEEHYNIWFTVREGKHKGYESCDRQPVIVPRVEIECNIALFALLPSPGWILEDLRRNVLGISSIITVIVSRSSMQTW